MPEKITPRTMIWMFDPPRLPYTPQVDPGDGSCVVPVAPVMLWATDVLMFSFTANWSASTTPETKGYLLSVSESSDFSTFVAGYEDLDVGLALSVNVAGLTRFTDYYMRVVAYDGACQSISSNTVYAQTSGEYLPVATDATNVDYQSFNANWDEFEEPVLRYYLDVATNINFTNFVPGYENLDVGNVLTYPVVGLNDDTEYYYRIRAETTGYLSDDSNIISARTVTIYTACATFGPSFNTPLASAMFLSADILTLSSGSLGNYVIEWRLNAVDGTVVYTSGDTTNPGEVQSQHPFIDEVVFAGTLYPTIKYMYVDGIKYTSAYDPVSRYSPDLLGCLAPVIITAVNCSTVLGTDIDYPYLLTYNNVTDTGLDKSRKIKFDLSPDTAYFAFMLDGYTVPEQIKIFYCTLLDPVGVLLDNFVHGSESSPGVGLMQIHYPTDYPNNPRVVSKSNAVFNPNLRYISRLDSFVYAAGNYIRIEIVGSYYNPLLTNTNWKIGLKCLTAADIDCTSWMFDTGISKIIDTPVMDFVSDPTCQYQVSYNTLDTLTSMLPPKSSSGNNLYRYSGGFGWWYGPTGGDHAGNPSSNPVKTGLRWSNTAVSISIHYTLGYQACMNLTSGHTVRIDKDTSVCVFTYSDQADYDKTVADIAAFHADPDYIAWSTMPDTDSRYYGMFRHVYVLANSCGDTMSDYYLYFWFGCPIYYDSVNRKITIEMVIPVNNCINDVCDGRYESVVININLMTTTKNSSFPLGYLISNVKRVGFLYATWIYYNSYADTVRESGFGMIVYEFMLNGLCDLRNVGFCDIFTSPGQLVFIKRWDKVTLTDPTDHASRLANWRLERKIGCRTDVCSDYELGDWEIVHEEP